MIKKLLGFFALVAVLSVFHMVPASAFEIDQTATDFEKSVDVVDFNLVDTAPEAPDIVAFVATLDETITFSGVYMAPRQDFTTVNVLALESGVDAFNALYSAVVTV